MQLTQVLKFEFGSLELYDNYVIGKIIPGSYINQDAAKKLLQAIKDHYGKRGIVYISQREFSVDLDLSIYKLVDPKRIVGVAIVSSKKEEIVLTASQEQALYAGSFGLFSNLDSAISWAKSFVQDDEAS